ncbi:extracellular solute-binding protein [Streptomyces polyrhachis]|uniref:Extracellular solute-binding protein n=1 Tax=Streptomyces polyrhachis TaxID=1282885 RepID=A0ABW2GI62_9ACTN
MGGISLTGCGAASGDDGGDVVLRLVAAEYGKPGGKTGSKHYWEELADSFTESHPGTRIEVKVVDWKYVDAEVKRMVDAGNPPDLAQTGSYADYADAGLLYSADEILSIATESNFVSSLAEAGQVNRTSYGLPFASSSRLLFFNKDLFTRAGLDAAKGPGSWGGIEAAAKALKGIGIATPFGLPLGPEEAQAESLLWMLGNGGGYTDQVGGYNLDAPENIEAFQWIQGHLTGKGLATADPRGTDREQVFADFTKGRVGMFFGHPTLMRAAKEAGIDLGIVEQLPGRSSPSSSTMGVVDWLMAFKANGHREAIKDFLDFVYSDEQVLRFSARYDMLPTTVTGVNTLRAKRPDLVPFLRQLDTAVFYPAEKTTWSVVSAKIKQQIGKAATSGGNAERILGDLQAFAQRETQREE